VDGIISGRTGFGNLKHRNLAQAFSDQLSAFSFGLSWPANRRRGPGDGDFRKCQLLL